MRGTRVRWVTLAVACACTVAFGQGANSHPAYAASFAVTVLDNSYSPEPFTIVSGTTVVWTNRGRVAHTVTSDDPAGEAFDSNTLAPGKSFSHTFNHAGVFTYHCSFHDNMLGTIIVDTSPAADPTVNPAPTVTPTAPPPSPTLVRKRLTTVRAVGSGGVARFSPRIAKIKVGTVVRWRNSTAVLHTVTSRGRGWIFKKSLHTNGTAYFTFRKPGTYSYYCMVHPGMVGTIIVHR